MAKPPLIGRWHHGQGYLVNGTVRIAAWNCDTNPPISFREEMLDWMCDTLNAAVNEYERTAPDELASGVVDLSTVDLARMGNEALANASGVPTPPPAPQAKTRCASECDLICQQPDGHGGCAKRSTPEQAVQGALTKAAQDVLAERQRQIDKEGWTPAHDDAHGGGEMASAAAVYALRASGHFESGVPTYWPWDFADYKPKDNRSNLIRAGALVLAEIERLDRMEVKNG